MRYSPAVLIGLLSLTGSLMAGPVLFSVSVVPVPVGFTVADGTGINNLGQVVGVAGNATQATVFVATGPNVVTVPLPASPSGLLPGSQLGSGPHINDSGQIVGVADVDGVSPGQVYFGSSSGVSYVTLPTTDLHGNSTTGALVYQLNNSGTFAGFTVSGPLDDQAFSGTGTGITQLPFDQALGINNAGHLLLNNFNLESPAGVFIFDGTNLNAITGFSTLQPPFDLTNADQAIGIGSHGATVSTAGGTTVIPTTPSLLFVTGNDEGQVVGTSDFSAFLWDSVNGTRQLSSLVPAGWTIQTAIQINDEGQILAFGTFMGGAGESLILNPVATPEPSTISMMLATIAFFATIHFARRRKLQPHNVVARVDE